MGRSLVGDPLGGGGERRQDAARAVALGVERYGGGDLEGAAAEFRRALKLWPDHPRARLFLGWVQRCLRLGTVQPPGEASTGAGELDRGVSILGGKIPNIMTAKDPRSSATPSRLTPSQITPPDRSASQATPVTVLPAGESPLFGAPSTGSSPAAQAPPSQAEALPVPAPAQPAAQPPHGEGDLADISLVDQAADAMDLPEIDLAPGDDEHVVASPGLGPEQAPPAPQLDVRPDAASLDLVFAETMGSGDLDLSRLIAEAEGSSEALATTSSPAAVKPPLLDEDGLLSIAEDLAEDMAQEAESASRLSALFSDHPAPALPPQAALHQVPAPASGLSDLLGAPPAGPQPPPSGLSDLLGTPSGEIAWPPPPTAPPPEDISSLFDVQEAPGQTGEQPAVAGLGELPAPCLDDIPLSDEPISPPPEVLLEEEDIELLPAVPPPSEQGPLVEADLFNDIQAPAPAESSRPLKVQVRSGESPEFIVDFDDVLSAEPEPTGTQLPPPPVPAKPPPSPSVQPNRLEEAQRAVGRGDLETAYRIAEEIIQQVGGDPGASALRPHLSQLASIYEAMLRPMDRIPRAGSLPQDLEPASAFLLSLLDGSMSIEDALTISGMERLRGARTLVALMRRGLLIF
ncbi:MAG: hypothetical protein NZ890_21325 [Myxococcota bacterium]|nr:hypothetical protein [Myxococcota bacterium]